MKTQLLMMFPMSEVTSCLRYKEPKYFRIQFIGEKLTSTKWQKLLSHYHVPNLEIGIEIDEHSIHYMKVKRIRLEEREEGLWVGELLLFSRSENEKQHLFHLHRVSKNKKHNELVESLDVDSDLLKMKKI
ncbi:hypothetical protein [Vagococcus fluvialis]|uniref:Uncharacterized protein n=1 Tax=Vagococcus fluvialis TaxID=2738 RepID=A0A7X6I3H6_9ENTE|nr:hypothetical protein [Vagococcus fluvialis]NKC68481.1 hypothetical protein [Vagococcus fluvialis]